MMHIAFVKTPTARYILNGTQTCESRLSINRHPARNCKPGDVILFKNGGGCALATVERVDVYENVTPTEFDALRELYAQHVDGPTPDPAYWEAKSASRFAVFVWLKDVRAIHVPGRLLPSSQSAWIQNYEPTPEVLDYLNR